MTKKSVLLIFIIFTLFISILASVVMAEETNDQKVEKAYSWLISKVKNKWQTLNVKQHVFSLLALNCNSTYFVPGNKSLYDKSFNSPKIRCWGAGPSRPAGESGCLLTETALSKIALDTWQDNTTKVRNWLLSRNMTQFSGIDWYLQIDVDRGSTASCEIIYGGLEEKWFNVDADKKVSINQSSSKCFYFDPNQPYWFRIRANSDCYSYRYTIKCWSNATIYRTNLLYKKSGSGIWYVSSETQTGRPGVPGSGKLEDQPNPLELQVPSYCLTNPGQNICDYEGTAWAARALAREGDKRDANMLVPYLVVFSDDNVKYFPSAFLYSVTGQERYNTEILAAEKIVGLDKGYWLVQPIVYGRVYDTAHAGLSLGGSAGDAITKAKNYLLFNQERDGNLVAVGYGEAQKEPIRDTAFALWALWGASCPGQGRERGGEENLTCIDLGLEYRCTGNETCDFGEIPVYNVSCENVSETCCKFIGAGGETDCTNIGGSCKDYCNDTEFETSTSCPDSKYCCKPLENGTCYDAGGSICYDDERCTGETINLSDGECCVDSCIPKDTENLNCIDIGTTCEGAEVCINSLTWNIEQFTTVKDTERCCAGTTFECVQDRSCSSIGKSCDIGETCSVSTEKTRDEEECCTGECSSAGTCESQGGNTCKSGQTCSMSYISASDTAKCCPSSGKCKGGTSLWWLWIILILIILGGAAYWYFFMFKKKKKPKEEKIEEGSIFGLPMTRPPVRPIPTTQKPMFRPQQQGQGTQGARPLQKPFMQQKPALKPLVSSNPMLKKAPNVPTPKPKGKTEDELEKTLNKLKKITKK